jgi:peptidoglycan/LPS O-acetylase OafA/YrhL
MYDSNVHSGTRRGQPEITLSADAKRPRIPLHLPRLERLSRRLPAARPWRGSSARRGRRLHSQRPQQPAGYLPGLDGLRALAVLAVLVYHASPGWLPGGFLGVEVFFTISGFIITRGLMQEWSRNGRISLRGFWLRRARRLLPALFLLLLGVMTYALLFETSTVAALRADVLAALAYVTNWHLVLGGQSYFDSFEKPSMLRHLWSLAVEEQFYVFWPMLLAFALPILKKNMTLLLVVVAAVASAVAMALLYEPGRDASRVYFATDTRASGLLLGAALAMALAGRTVSARRLLTVLGALGLAGLVALVVVLDEGAMLLYRGGFLATGLLTAAVILAVTRPGRLTSLLGIAPLRWLGVRSYGIYLWHWPILLLTWPSQVDAVIVLGQVAAAVGIAALSYKLVEQPIREGALARLGQGLRRGPVRFRGTALAGGAVAVALVAGLVVAAALARAPERPDYFSLESVRIRNNGSVSTQDAGVAPAGSVWARVHTGFAQLTSVPLPCPPMFACGADASLLVSVDFNQSTMAPAGDAVLADLPTGVDPEPEPAPSEPPAAPRRAAASAPAPMPAARVVPAETPLVTAIGDSVMMGAAARLAGSIPNIDLDSQVGRQSAAAIALLRERQSTGQLGQIVLVHIGNNGTLTHKQFDEIMSILGSERRVIFLNLQVARSWQDGNNAVLAAGVQRYANARLIDWHSITAGHPELFAADQIHLSGAGAELYTRLVIEAVLG